MLLLQPYKSTIEVRDDTYMYTYMYILYSGKQSCVVPGNKISLLCNKILGKEARLSDYIHLILDLTLINIMFINWLS